MVIEDAYERRYMEDKYFDIPLGYQIIRGDEICLLGEVVFPFTLSLSSLGPRGHQEAHSRSPVHHNGAAERGPGQRRAERSTGGR